MPADRRPTIADRDSLEFVEELQALQGEEMPADQDAVLEPDEIESRRQPTLTEMDHGAPPRDTVDDAPTFGSLDGLALDALREGETDDAIAATEEGLAYVPPNDPPPDPLDDVGAIDELDLNGRVRDALRADAATAAYADQLVIATVGSRAVIEGIVDGVDDTDAIVEVVERVPGITEVDDRTTLSGE